MEIILVRHPETIAPKGMCYGSLDLELKDPVEITRERVIQNLTDRPDLIIASPLPRAKKLADSLAEYFNHKEVKTDDRLMEMHFGDWEGKMWDELPKYETKHWMKNFVTANAPNGESFLELEKRVLHFAEEWWLHPTNPKIQNLENRRLMIVSHSAPIRVLICQRQGIPLAQAFKLNVDFGSVTIL
ncbi:phosphoglycerate kinase [Leptospira ognonensis]|uniref:Phosphoglycerate kinase n=1 Tax=Leptospira ognonensis TaxID=2484945 RepID=A0A4R9K3L5_9LEPT|nr:histidine phosphatase family protein [Leptospira ognonensis]TGL60091.1 phosphoglycerate kinase [Leptospira ognonensis]